MATHVLVVDDLREIAYPLVVTLEREGYDVDWVDNGEKALAHLAERPPAVCILDLGLPDIDGLEVCRRAREGGFTGAILVCSARSQELDRVVALDSGADDYLQKPFGLAELQARVRALLRRSAPAPVLPPQAPGGLRIDRAARKVSHDGRDIPLTAKEFDVLALLATEPGAVVSREQIMDYVWDENWFGSTKTLDVTIGRLRQKLEDAGAPERIVNVRGVGFRLEQPVT